MELVSFKKRWKSRFLRNVMLLAALIIGLGLQITGQRREGVFINTGVAMFVSPDHGKSWSRLPFGVSPTRIHKVRNLPGGRALAAAKAGLFLKAGWGARWERVLREESFAAGEAHGRLFAGTRQGLLVSHNGGRSWHRIESLPEGLVPLSIEIAPSDERVIYIGTATHGVLRSDDLGQSWREVSNGLPPSVGASPVTPVVNMAVDPRDSRVVYVASEVHGIYKTSDGGQSWQAINTGLPKVLTHRTYPPLVAISPENPDAVYAVIGNPINTSRIENALYKTLNGGKHWRELTGLTGNLIFRSLTISEDNPRELFLGYEGGVVRVFDDPRWEKYIAEPAPEIRERGVRAEAQGCVPGLDIGGITLMVGDKKLFHEFDKDGKTLEFAPVSYQGQFQGYDASFITHTFITGGGSKLFIGGDGSAEQKLPFPFNFFGQVRTSVFINANGSLTFESGDPDPTPSPLEFVTKHPRISAFWTDLDPVRAGSISVISTTDRFTVTWAGVPEAGQEGVRNTFQISLFADGRITFSYNGMQSVAGFVGISPGGRAQWYDDFIRKHMPDDQPNFFLGDYAIGEHYLAGLYYPEVACRFYATPRPDEFDLLVIYGSSLFEAKRSITGRFADPDRNYSMPVAQWVKNEIMGIGVPIFDQTSFYSSAGRLRMVVNMDKLSQYPADPVEKVSDAYRRFVGPKSAMDILAQMVGHAWMAYVRFDDGGIASDEILSGTERYTWSFFLDTNASEEDGNKWEPLPKDKFRSVEGNERYSSLDQYLMGLRKPDEVEEFFLIQNPTETGGRTRESLPELGVMVAGQKRIVKVDDIIRVEGPRVPPFEHAPKIFNLGFILVIPEGTELFQFDYNKINLFRCCFEYLFYEKFTGMRGRVTTGCPVVGCGA